MKIRIEAEETGELFTELDMNDLDIDKLLTYAITRLQKEDKDFKLPTTDEEFTILIGKALNDILKEEIKKA